MPEASARQGVFVSYARDDGEAFARELRERLVARGIPVWHDRDRMAGGRDWWEQIREALNRVEYMALVMTPAAAASETVRREWRYARQQGVCICPVFAPGSRVDTAALPRWMSSVHWYDLAHQEERFFNDLNTRCEMRRVPFMAEPLPAGFVPRKLEFRRLKASLLAGDTQEPVAITAAFRGAGGYGKTTLARAICDDDDIQNAYDDGILWVTLGEAPGPSELIGKLKGLIEMLSGERPSFEDLDAASARLRELLADRDILLVIDDVWRAADLAPFLSGGTRCARLITTRRADTLPVGAVKVAVDQMRAAEANALIAQGLPTGHEPALHALAVRLGEWPLLLKLANAWLRKRINERGEPAARALEAFDLALGTRGVTVFDPKLPAQRNEAVAKSLEVSLAGLAPADRERLLDLAVFDEDLDIPLTVLARYWQQTGQLDAFDVEETCQRLFDESLLVDFSLLQRSLRLHDAIRAWLIGRAGPAALAARHAQLLASYAGQPVAWHRVPDDGYLHAHLAKHLAAAGRLAELRALLFDLDWIEARLLASGDVQALLGDHETLAGDPDLALVTRALQKSTHPLATHPRQVGLQLYGRLGRCTAAPIRELCERALARAAGAALLPMWPALAPVGDAAGRSSDDTTGAAFLGDSGQALTWSAGGGLHVWCLDTGRAVHELVRHAGPVAAPIVFDAGRRALAWSNDGALTLWDLQHGRLLHTLASHRREVLGAVVTADGSRALSWSRDRTLKLWDLARGVLIGTLTGGRRAVTTELRLALDDRRALSCTADGVLELWDLERGGLLATLAADRGAAGHLTVLDDGSHLALAQTEQDGLQAWDLAQGTLVHRLGGPRARAFKYRCLNTARRLLCWGGAAIEVWDLRSGERLKRLDDQRPIFDLAVSRDGRCALSWGHWEVPDLHFWDLDRGQLVRSVDGDSRRVSRALFLGDGRRALSWGWNGAIELRDLLDDTLLFTMDVGPGRVDSLTPLADERWLLTASMDRVLRLWDLRDRRCAGSYLSDAGLSSVSVAPDASRILAVDSSNRAHCLRLTLPD